MRQGLNAGEKKPKVWRMFLALGVLVSYAVPSVLLPPPLAQCMPWQVHWDGYHLDRRGLPIGNV